MFNEDNAGKSIYNLYLRNPDFFVAGELHNQFCQWEKILFENDTSNQVKNWIKNGVDVTDFFTHFRGNFRGSSYNSLLPPKRFFHNSPVCKQFKEFICSELYERIVNGSLSVVGKIGECELPHTIMPLTVEPTKPRLCHDDRYINLWTKDMPFQLENLKHVPRMVEKDMKMITCDEKSGYDHVNLCQNSRKYFGIQFGGWVLTYNTLPFGWKASPYIYQTIGMQVTNYLRSKNIYNIQYIDDRLAIESTKVNITEVAYVLLELLTKLEYTLSWKKSQFVPSQIVRYLGYFIDSSKMAFFLPDEKKISFSQLRESILLSRFVDIRTLQRFAGKCISFCLVVPAAKLYCREVNRSISCGMKNSQMIKVENSLKEELEHWRFIDTWGGCMTWRLETHKQIILATDSSGFKYGGKMLSGKLEGLSLSDFWSNDDSRPIHLKEAEAVYNVLYSCKENIKNSRVDVLCDNMAVVNSWANQGGKDKQLTDIMKQLFQFVYECNISLNLQYVQSKLNVADEPSRSISLSDSMLSETSWAYVEQLFGPHTVDLMSLDSNCMKDRYGKLLRHFTPYPTPLSGGVNVFVQNVNDEENPYVFPPFQMIFPLLSLLKEKNVKHCTMVLPIFQEKPVWWPFLHAHCISKTVLGRKGDVRVLKVPTSKGFINDVKGLKNDLGVFRLQFR
ncbi:uncharacterized protein LOC134252891 [Saccostrea cucullata]|uniref:uncharacterized protein LOC134252891 n=1 Tax=Saccostrea cuccullata TaxID=36930 RepID=UPI002ED3C071